MTKHDKDNIVNLCEMKYVSVPYLVSKDEHEKLENRMEIYRRRFGKSKIIHLTLVTPVGLAHNDYAWSVQSVVTVDDLFHR